MIARTMTADERATWVNHQIKEIGMRCPECHEPAASCPYCGCQWPDRCRHHVPGLPSPLPDECYTCRVQFAPADLTLDDAPLWVVLNGEGESVAYGNTELEAMTVLTEIMQ